MTENRTQVEIKRKLRMQLADRLVGWFTLVCYFFPLIGRYLNAQGLTQFDESLMFGMGNLFWIFIFLHSIAAIYMYGIPKYKNNLRIMNMYLGVLMFLIIFVNRSLSAFPALEQVFAFVLMIPATLHSLIGVRLFLQRLLKKEWDAPMPFYTGGNITRDI